MALISQIYPRHDDLWFAARMTQIQCDALKRRCNLARALKSLAQLEHFVSLRPRSSEVREIQPWVTNAWNTEQVLHLSRSMFEGEGLRNALQWAFPQAYYSVYTMTVAYFVSSGFTERLHRTIIHKFGQLALQEKYPSDIAFVVHGAKPYQHHNLSPGALRSSTDYDPTDPGIVDGQVLQFLNGTRDDDLSEKKQDMHIKTKTGKLKRGFNKSDWESTSSKLGPTSLLSLLYRKRIKANYRDIDTFLARNLDPGQVFDSLIAVVACLNGVHGALILRTIGSSRFDDLLKLNSQVPFLSDRVTLIKSAAP